MAVADAGPKIYVVLNEREHEVPTQFNFTWTGTTLTGSYMLYIDDIPSSEIYFPGSRDDESIFLTSAEIDVKQSTKLELLKMPKSKRFFEVKKMLGIRSPKEHYTIDELQQLHKPNRRSIVFNVDKAIASGNPRSIIRVAKRVRFSPDQILDLYCKAQELRSNFLMNVVRILSRS